MPVFIPVRRLSLALAASVLLVFSATAAAQPRPLEEGAQYEVIVPPVPTASAADRIEMKEIFWYGCPQCYVMEPMMTSWRDGIAGDLDFRRSPAVWNAVMEIHARLYYTAEALDALDTLHRAAFKAVHEEGNPLASEELVKEFFVRHGVSADAFAQAWNSEEVVARVDAARIGTGDYGIEKLPSLVVNGTYRVAQNHGAPTHVDMVVAVNMLIRKIRDDRRDD